MTHRTAHDPSPTRFGIVHETVAVTLGALRDTSALAVYVALAITADGSTGRTTASVTALCQRSGLCRQSVVDALTRLADLGLIVRAARRGQSPRTTLMALERAADDRSQTRPAPAPIASTDGREDEVGEGQACTGTSPSRRQTSQAATSVPPRPRMGDDAHQALAALETAPRGGMALLRTAIRRDSWQRPAPITGSDMTAAAIRDVVGPLTDDELVEPLSTLARIGRGDAMAGWTMASAELDLPSPCPDLAYVLSAQLRRIARRHE